MKQTYNPKTAAVSTYTLLVRSEEKERSLSETAVYLLFTLSAVFSIWQAAQQPVNLPTGSVLPSATVVHSAPAQNQGV